MTIDEDRRDYLIQLHKSIIDLNSNYNNKDIWTGSFYHYTSIGTLFNILKNDSLWASNARFSNDASEEILINTKSEKVRDDYIICFCSEGDMLSQWRGYCYNGGVSIQFDLSDINEYSIIGDDGNDVVIENTPLPVVYIKTNFLDPEKYITNIKRAMTWAGFKNPSYEEIIPFIKNRAFIEEKEYRLVFSNNEESPFDKCINHRTLSSGVLLPYIKVGFGNLHDMNSTKPHKEHKYDNEEMIKNAINGKTIWIDEGSDQKNIYFNIRKKINEYIQKNPAASRNGKDVKIYCRGHWPIRKIIVGPSDDKERIQEQIQHYCATKYWLQNVVVETSKIPYIRPVS